MLPPTESDFNRQICILSLVCHVKEHASRSPTKCNSVEQKHLSLLDYIALLLVTKSHGYVAAVIMEHTVTSLNFYFAKNRHWDHLTLSFVNRILKLLKGQPLEFIQKSMLMIVMVNCVEKVNGRIRKSQKALEEVGEINIAQSPPSLNQGKVVDSWEGLDNLQIISSFLIELKKFVTATPIMRANPETSMWLCIRAFLIGSITLYPFVSITTFSNTVIGNAKLLSDYPTLDRRLKNLLKFPRTINCCQFSHSSSLALHFVLFIHYYRVPISPTIRKTTNNYSQVRSPIHQTVKIPKSVRTLLNEDAEKHDEEHVTMRKSKLNTLISL